MAGSARHAARGSQTKLPTTVVPHFGDGSTVRTSDAFSAGSKLELTMPIGTSSAVACTVKFVVVQPRTRSCAWWTRTLISRPNGPASGGGSVPQSW